VGDEGWEEERVGRRKIGREREGGREREREREEREKPEL